jgi:hypothetical protein
VSRTLAALAVVTVAAGCGADRKVHSSSEKAPTRPAVPQVAPIAKPLLIARDAAGPIRLGMTRAAATKAEGFTVAPATLRLEGTPTPVLRYERSGEVVAVAELTSGRISRIRVLSPQFRTSEGAHVGSDARELAKQYGAGRALTGEGNVCAAFAKAPGRSFCFRTTPDLLLKPDWKKVVTRNPVVEVILVEPVK